MDVRSLKIPCLHETNDVADPAETVVDHHPLSKDEVKMLLIAARRTQGDGVALAHIQVRMCQAVVGMTYPRPIDGDVARRDNEIQTILVQRPQVTDELVEQIYGLLQD